MHVDKKDKHEKGDYREFVRQRIDNLNDDSEHELKIYLNLWDKMLVIGTPTTCNYQFITCDEDCEGELVSLFLLDGMKLAIQLRGGCLHSFYAHAFLHRTTIPVLLKNNRVWVNHPSHNLFAWGAGSKAD